MSTDPFDLFFGPPSYQFCTDPSSSDLLNLFNPALVSVPPNPPQASPFTAPMLSQQQLFSSQFAGGVPIAPRRQQGHMRSMTDTSGYHQPQGMSSFVGGLHQWNFDHPMQSVYAFPLDFGMDLARTQPAMDFDNSNLAAANAQFMGPFENPLRPEALAPPREAPPTPSKVTSTTPVGGTPKTPFRRTHRPKPSLSIESPSTVRQRQLEKPLTSPLISDGETVEHSDTGNDDKAAKSHIDTDSCLVSTGITEAMINREMTGPDGSDGQYTCIYQGCGKRFGRKENIRSHVQTHLGDRRYVCPLCEKPFVRAHDLKRHFSIHDGDRAYKCKCGNSFARHDALTRHRQRGMCVGAFDGCVKKVQKRGRPRKARPTDAERQEKSKKTRVKNMSISSMDSIITLSSDASQESSRPGTRDSDMGFGTYESFGSDADFDPMATIRPRDYQRVQQNSTAPMPSSSSQASVQDLEFCSPRMTPQSHVSLEEIENSPLPLTHASSPPPRPLSPSDLLPAPPALEADFTFSSADLTDVISASPVPFEIGEGFASAMQITEANNDDYAVLANLENWS